MSAMDTSQHPALFTTAGQRSPWRRARRAAVALGAGLAGLAFASAALAQQASPPETERATPPRPLDLSLRSAASAAQGPRATEASVLPPYGSGYESRRPAGAVAGSASAAAGEPAKARPAPSIWTQRSAGGAGRGGGGGGGRGRR